MKRFKSATFVCALAALGASQTLAVTVDLHPTKDNTLIESTTGDLSNGAGSYFFAGTTVGSSIRRGLLAFDVAGNIPAGATISSATLRLHMSRTASAGESVELHRALSDWGEGTSIGFLGEGGGAPSTPNDATWLHTFYDTAFWTNPGGDFDPLASAAQTVVGNGFYTWNSTARLVADVQTWLDQPTLNAGWLVRGDEAFPQTAKRFDSGQIPDLSVRPVLTINFQPVPEPASVVLLAVGLIFARKRFHFLKYSH